ncbi:BTB/POZ and MATH domain-containing protein 2 [Brachypodium distachyon]|uniref:BTB domain-containing protein n=1 Tax=Brachypodium distachyon TaxID=15368 RepID=I1J210_BRADI|nr:BTB/POZ and MATH domain-containing protein 2 [Brachypodium distachyon]KQJ84707.1 hypothetical protein BRADI_5g22362v3 [Brachypodium distachyon]|eukprot:XP_003579320.1 BTB/POZ and MATH domain-containing protein 2 [Brachypodium distachyon]
MGNSSTSAANHGQPSLPKTSSRCVPESFTGAHDFELTNYPLLDDGVGVGKFVSSSTFSVGGYDWAIRFYPNGWKEGFCAGNVSAYIYCVDLAEGASVTTKFTLNMLEKEGKAKVTNYGRTGEHTFSLPINMCGYGNFAEKSKLESLSRTANNGNFIIRCVLTVIKEPRTERSDLIVLVPQTNLAGHLGRMWKDEQGADVTFSVGGQLFSAHRFLLAARSPVFKAELFGPMKEKSAQLIKIDDIEPPIFEALLHFVYTDSMPDDEHCKEGRTEKLQHLLVAADRYGLDRLKVLCESELSKSIDAKTVATTLVLAEQHHCKVLKEACLEFMVPPNVLRAVMATDGFRHLLASCPLVTMEILDKMCRSE